MTFEEIGLDEEIIKAISDLGFETPTPIQEKAIPELLASNRDMIALAQTGTGKTAAYGLPMIQQVDFSSKIPQGIVICPTRELCMQITKDIDSYSKYLDGIRTVAVYGGAKIETQINKLHKGAQIVACTPGRALDLIKRKKLNITEIKFLVIDEADEIFTMGFKEELDGILKSMPDDKQTMLFSATMPAEIKGIVKKYMTNPYEITVGKKNTGAKNVQHEYYMVRAEDRYEALKRIADINPDIYGIVFCRTRRETKEIADKLIQDGYNADALHGDLSQAQRDIVMNRFRDRHLQFLVATDVAARGLDVNDLSHIINFKLPEEQEVYIHRSGRTGRAGKSGISISIVHSRAQSKIRSLEKKIGKKFEKKEVPGGRAVCEKRLFNLIDRLDQVDVDEEQIKPFLDDIYAKTENMSREEFIKKFVWMEFDRYLSYYKGSRDLNYNPDRDRKGRRDRNDRNDRRDGKKSKGQRRETDFAKFYINLGLRHRMSAQKIMGIINEGLGNSRAMIGKISLMKKFSFFEIDSRYKSDVVDAFQQASYNGEMLLVEPVANDDNEEESGYGKRKKSKKNKYRRKLR